MTELYVLDQNIMRKPALRGLIAAKPEAFFVIPDTSLVEMVKSEQWEYTFRRSFEALAPVVDRCFMSVSVQEAREREIEQGTAVDLAALLPADFTDLLRGAILGSQYGGSGPAMQMLRESMADVRVDLALHDLNAPANREELVNRVAEARRQLPPEDIRACRQEGELGRQARRQAAIAIGNGLYFAHFRELGVSTAVKDELWVTRSMNLRWAYMLAHQTVYWLGIGGLEPMADKDVLNDVLDQDYVLIGSFFTGILSCEHSLLHAHEDLKSMLELPLTTNAPAQGHVGEAKDALIERAPRGT